MDRLPNLADLCLAKEGELDLSEEVEGAKARETLLSLETPKRVFRHRSHPLLWSRWALV